MMWAVGATLGPLVVAGAVSLGDWRLAYLALAAAFVPLATVVWRLPTPAVGGDEPLDVAALRRVLRDPRVLLMAAGIVLSTGVEGGLFTWLTTYAEGRLPGALSTASLSVLLAAYVPGRLASGRLAERVGYLRLTVALVGCCLLSLAYTLFLAEGLGLLVGLFAVGFTLSGQFPTLLAYATESVPEHSAPVNAVSLVVSAAGIAGVPVAMGFVIQDVGVVAAMRLLLVPLALLFVVLGAAWARTGATAE
jgi:fucose permease